MQTVPSGWVEARSGLYRWETKVEIAGVAYGEDRIIHLNTSAALYAKNTVSIGGCVAKEINLSILPQGDIPRMAEIRVWIRPVATGIVTEWLPKGVFYIDSRATDRSSGIVAIHGFDAMLKAEQTFLTDVTEDDWPKPMNEVVAEIAERIGVTVDGRTIVSDAFLVEYPNDYTMREILGYVAVAHAGNWIVTDAGKLRLISLADMPEETHYLVTEDGSMLLFGNTKILV